MCCKALNSVWGLSRTYRHIKLASKLSSGCDYALFKVGSAQGTEFRVFPSWMTGVWAATDARVWREESLEDGAQAIGLASKLT